MANGAAIKATNEQPNKKILRIEPQSRFPKGKKCKIQKYTKCVFGQYIWQILFLDKLTFFADKQFDSLEVLFKGSNKQNSCNKF